MKTTDMTKREFGIAKAAAANFLASARAGHRYTVVDGDWKWVDATGKVIADRMGRPV